MALEGVLRPDVWEWTSSWEGIAGTAWQEGKNRVWGASGDHIWEHMIRC